MHTNTSGIYITATDLQSLPTAARDAILGLLSGASTRVSDIALAAVSDVEDENFAELSPGQARTFLEGCSVKTKKALETIVSGPTRFFQVADVARALDVSAPELRGVWGGLTRRTQTITNDSDAYLIDWTKGEAVYDDEDNYIDQRGEVAELTYRSLRKAFGLV